MKKILAIALFMAASLALADGGTSTSSATATSTATAGSPTNTVTVTGGSGDGISNGSANRPASSAAGFGFGVSSLTCGGTAGAGGQGHLFGFSIGGSYEMEDCMTVRAAMTLEALGMHKAALARMCTSAANRKAFDMAGETACAGWADDVRESKSSASPIRESKSSASPIRKVADAAVRTRDGVVRSKQ